MVLRTSNTYYICTQRKIHRGNGRTDLSDLLDHSILYSIDFDASGRFLWQGVHPLRMTMLFA